MLMFEDLYNLLFFISYCKVFMILLGWIFLEKYVDLWESFFFNFIVIVICLFNCLGSVFIVGWILIGIFIIFFLIDICFFLGNFFICINGIFWEISFFFNGCNFKIFGLFGYFILFFIDNCGIFLFFKVLRYVKYNYLILLIDLKLV